MQTIGIRSVKSLGIQNTLDFEVDHKDHNFYAEGLVTSNSHAINYASISALTVYLKFKYPINFFLSLLKETINEPDPIGEIAAIQKELKYFGIELLPPHLLKSDFEFKIEGNNIRFGLSSIKGISDQTIKKLIDFRKPYSNKFELFKAAADCKIPIGVLAGLIQAGTMDDASYNVSRSRLVLEAQIWNILTDKEQLMFLEWSGADEIEFNNKFNFNVIKMILYFTETLDEKGKPYIKASRFETIKKNYQKYKEVYQVNSKSEKLANFFYERLLIGYSYSEKLFDIFKKSCPDLINIQEALDTFEEEQVVTVGIIEELTEWVSRNEKKTKCCKIKLVDEAASLTCMFFNDTILDIKENSGGKLPKENDIVALRGVKKKDAIFVNSLFLQSEHIFLKHSELKAFQKEKE